MTPSPGSWAMTLSWDLLAEIWGTRGILLPPRLGPPGLPGRCLRAAAALQRRTPEDNFSKSQGLVRHI